MEINEIEDPYILKKCESNSKVDSERELNCDSCADNAKELLWRSG